MSKLDDSSQQGPKIDESTKSVEQLERGLLDGITKKMEAALPGQAAQRLDWLMRSVSLPLASALQLIEGERESYGAVSASMKGIGEEAFATFRRGREQAILRVKEMFMDIAIEYCIAEGVGQREAEQYVEKVFSSLDTTLPETSETL